MQYNIIIHKDSLSTTMYFFEALNLISIFYIIDKLNFDYFSIIMFDY